MSCLFLLVGELFVACGVTGEADCLDRHAGMPNHTSETRVMLAFGYQAR